MGNSVRNEHGEEQEEYQDARVGHVEQIRAYDMDFTTSLMELFALFVTSSHSCIVLPSTNVTHFDLKPHVIQLLLSFHSLDHECLTTIPKNWRTYVPHSNFKISQKSQSISDYSNFPFKVKLGRGWIPTRLDLLHRGKAYWPNFTINFSRCKLWTSAKKNLFVHSGRRWEVL